MPSDEPREKHAEINPAARRDGAGRPVAGREEPSRRERPKGYQDAELDPRDQGGIAE